MIVDDDVRDELSRARRAPVPGLDERERDQSLETARARLPRLTASPDPDAPVRCVAPIGASIQERLGTEARSAFAAALISSLALDLVDRLPSMDLPGGVLGNYRGTFRRLASFLNTADLGRYWSGDDDFQKDLRLTGGYSVPCGAQDVDLYAQIGRRSGAKALVLHRQIRSGLRLLASGGPPWFTIHTDSRYTDEFDEPGWRRCYLLIAELLERRPDVKGVVGTSWFYDPQLPAISPRLAYLQTMPLSGGAYPVRHGPGAIHTERATATSPSRRKLVEDGSYVPICYSIVWPRAELIAWAGRQRI